jgi:hypothetical protein
MLDGINCNVDVWPEPVNDRQHPAAHGREDESRTCNDQSPDHEGVASVQDSEGIERDNFFRAEPWSFNVVSPLAIDLPLLQVVCQPVTQR